MFLCTLCFITVILKRTNAFSPSEFLLRASSQDLHENLNSVYSILSHHRAGPNIAVAWQPMRSEGFRDLKARLTWSSFLLTRFLVLQLGDGGQRIFYLNNPGDHEQAWHHCLGQRHSLPELHEGGAALLRWGQNGKSSSWAVWHGKNAVEINLCKPNLWKLAHLSVAQNCL